MRGLIFLFVVALSFLLVLKFYRVSETEAGGSGEPRLEEPAELPAADPAGGRFVEPARPPASRPTAADEGTAAPVDSRASGEERPEWLRELQTAEPARRWDPAVSWAVAHGTPEELERALDTVPEDELGAHHRGLLRAFVAALAGDRVRAEEWAAQLDEDAVGAAELDLLKRAFGARVATRRAGSEAGSPLVFAMEHRLLEREAEGRLEAGEFAAAARAFSDLLLGELDAPWESDRGELQRYSDRLDTAQERHRWNPRADWPADEVVVEAGDHLTGIRARYLAEHPGRLMCTGLIERANRISRYIHAGDRLRIPTDPASVRVDLSARWVLYMLGDEVADAWPVGIGREGLETITGSFVAGEKEVEPMWWRRGQPPVPFGDPANPLGTRWIEWYRDGEPTSYGFHGTNDPASIGTAASEGCVRFRNEDVEVLFDILPLGAPIQVRQ